MIMTKNVLDENRYIISSELHKALDLGSLGKENIGKIDKNDKGLYVVVFRVINNNNTNVLVYNYIYYDYIFALCLLTYISTRSKYYNMFSRELGNYLCVLDKSLYTPLSSIGCAYSNSLIFNSKVNRDELNNSSKEYCLNIFELYHLFNKVNYLSNVDVLCNLIEYSIKRNYSEFLNLVFDLTSIRSNISLNKVESENNFNILNNCLFIVTDLVLLRSSLESKGFCVSGGSQKWRDQVNSMNNFLNILDMDFRNCMYNHNRFHVLNDSIYRGDGLDKSKFSFGNIHKRLGSVRCYSTKIQSKVSFLNNNLSNKQTIRDNNIIYDQLGEFFNNLPVNNDTQLIVENFLLKYSKSILDKKLDKRSKNNIIDYDLVSVKFTELLNDKRNMLDNYINNTRKRTYMKKPKEKELPLYYLNKLLQIVKNDFVCEVMFGKVLIIISNNNVFYNLESKIYMDMGNDIINNYYYNLYSIDKEDKNIRTLSDWKENNQDIVDIFENNETKVLIGSILGSWLIEMDLIFSSIIVVTKKETYNILKPTEEVLSTLKDKNIKVSLPKRMPMIVKPKPYYRETIEGKIKERLGGYLLNDEKITQSLIIDKWNLKYQSKIKDTNAVYDCINNLSCVGYKINKDVLNFIDLYGVKFNLYLYDEKIESLFNKSKLNKSDYLKLDSYLSKRDLEDNILGIAKAYSNIHEFFIPVRIDFRGRITCTSEYLNYQSSELAKSLLLFSKPEKIYKTDETAISYLKAYGASCYGNRIDKESWNNRIKWINNNEHDIINFHNGKLINGAENKLLFIAFCFEYNRFVQSLYYNDNPYFETYLPIQLDATCNGYQHLALLSSDHMLAKELSLTTSSWDEPPKDFYNFVAVKLIGVYNSKLQSNSLSDDLRESYLRLFNLDITRKILKSAIMTRSYNISPLEMIRKIQQDFYECEDMSNVEFSERWYQYSLDPKMKLKIKDFSLIRQAIEEVLKDESFKLHKLIKYLDGIARILTKLGLIIPWGSPSGVEINQSYLAPKQIKLKPFSYSKKTFTLHIPDEHFNNRKQVRAFMPNIIHSLDAGSLALLVDLYFKSSNGSKSKSFFSIHDCFAVTANNVDIVKNLLKHVYTIIYSDNIYLRDLDKGIKEYIKLNYGNDSVNEESLEVSVKGFGNMKFPSIEGVLGTNAEAANIILDDTYIIH